MYNISLIEQFFKPEKDEKEKGEEVSILRGFYSPKEKETWQKKPEKWQKKPEKWQKKPEKWQKKPDYLEPGLRF